MRRVYGMTEWAATFSIRLDADTDRRVRKTAGTLGRSRGAVIRECIKTGLGALEAQADQRAAAFGNVIDAGYFRAVHTAYWSQFGEPGSPERRAAESRFTEQVAAGQDRT